MKRMLALILEFLAVFAAVPLLIYTGVLPNWPIPFLLLVSCGAFFILRADATFDLRGLVRFTGVRERIWPLLLRDAFLMALLGLTVWWLTPDLLFSFVKRSPIFWAAIMVLYPLVSVFPQEVLFRAFFFHRYEPLFGSRWGMVAASALAFGWVHIIFGNWISVALTAVGGVLFAATYRKSGSLMLVCIEHALFGNFIFTIGIGRFFVPGAHHSL
jgi:membrane protease YdiL (CAAX protease family)